MKPLAFSLLLLLLPSTTPGKGKSLPPFAAELSQPQVVEILAYSNSNQVKYLGFDWIDTYCFGRLIGCAVSDQPATAEYSYGEIIFKSGDWFICATCFGDGPNAAIKLLMPCWQPDTRVEISAKKNGRTLIVGEPGQKFRAGMGHTYTVVAAYNQTTQEDWGSSTIEAWRLVLASIEITAELKPMSVDRQLSWSAKILALRGAGLVTADNLEKLLAEMRSSK